MSKLSFAVTSVSLVTLLPPASTTSRLLHYSQTRQSRFNAANAYSYISGIAMGTPRDTTWFGTYNPCRKSTVQSHYRSINSLTRLTNNYTCIDTGTYA